MKNKKSLFVLVFIMLFLLPISVKAEDIQFNLCFSNAGAFSIRYDTDVSTQVDAAIKTGLIFNDGKLTGVNYDKVKSIITLDVIAEGHLPYPQNITEEEKVQYQFSATQSSFSCYVDGSGDIKSCPSSSQTSKYDYLQKFVNSSDKYITRTLDVNNGKFDIKIKDPYNDEVSLRYVSSGREENELGLDASSYQGQFLTRGSDGYFTINDVKEASSVLIEVYVKKSGECSGSYLGSFSILVPDNYDYEISNPAKTRPDYYGCKRLFDFTLEGMSAEEKSSQFEPAKKSYVSECYSSNITYGELNSLQKTITSKVDKFINMFSDYKPSASSGESVCNSQATSNKIISYYDVGRYWGISCGETYTASGDTAKLVKAGSGFEYQTNYTVTRKCDIFQVSKPSKRPACTYTGGSKCHWKGKNTGYWFEGKDAGPTEDFDNCVYKCDGGSYSQSCINSCYSEVYGNDRDLSFTDKFSYTQQNSNIQRSGLIYHDSSIKSGNGGSCTTDKAVICSDNGKCYNMGGNPGRWYNFTNYGLNISFCISNGCAAGAENYCEVWVYQTPDNCSGNPEADYNAELAQSERELNEYIRKQKELISAGEYEYQITDSYLKTKDGKNYVYKVNSSTDPMVNISQTQETIATNPTSAALGNSGGKTVNYSASTTVKSDIVVSLPLSYVEKINGNVVYTSNKDANVAFSVNHKLSKFDRVDFTSNRYYHDDGERKYYTNIFTKDLNVVVKDNKIQLVRTTDYNIKVVSSNVGDGEFGSDILCYYGVYNQFYDEEPDDCDPKKEICGGIQWIYRPIELTDVFPNNREPRWNWTGTLNRSNHTYTGAARFSDQTTLRYNIDPISLTKDIEAKGNAIFDVQKDASEVDYEFVLTKENLDNIRNYNKNVDDYNGDGYNNYMDYNMSCYKDGSGKEICTSRFLDNINANSGTESASNFITYSVSGFTIDARKNIAGCNNSKSGACIEIGG